MNLREIAEDVAETMRGHVVKGIIGIPTPIPTKENKALLNSAAEHARSRVGQRQDSLHDQMMDVIRLATRAGYYDAADWITKRWNVPGAKFQ